MTTPPGATVPSPLPLDAEGPLRPGSPQTRSRRARRTRLALLATAGVVAVALLLLTVSGAGSSGQALDPENPGRSGTRALAQVLREQGVQVEIVRGIDDLEAAAVDAHTTVLVGDVTYLGTAAAERTAAHVRGARRLVVLEPDDVTLEDLALPVQVVGLSGSDLRAGCTSDLADPTDVLTVAATLYAPARSGSTGSAGVTSCYVPPAAGSAAPSSGDSEEGSGEDQPGAALVVLPSTVETPETVVLGAGAALSNGHITEAAHAALGLRVLGPVDRLIWYMPDVTDLDVPGPDGQRADDAGRGVPEWFTPGVVLIGLVVVVYALARGRRLGRLVTEPLPVVVRAAETTEARGRLYHRASDRALAAEALRSGTRTRLVARLGLPPGAAAAGLVDAVARSTGHPPTDVEAMLDGPTPDTDRDLLLLAQRLADLEESVRPA